MLNNVVGVFLVQVFFLLIGQQGLGAFFGYRPLLPIGLRIAPTLEENIQRSAKCQLLLVQCKQHANPVLSRNNYTPLVISRNYKNK
jgi:hypothetical protein